MIFVDYFSCNLIFSTTFAVVYMVMCSIKQLQSERKQDALHL